MSTRQWYRCGFWTTKRAAVAERNRYRPRVEPLEDRTTPSLIGTPMQNFVDQVYHDLLDRPADPSALTFWTARLTQGLSRSQFALDVQGSIEQRIDQVDAAYQKILNRPADPAGLVVGTAFLAGGGTEFQLEGNLLASGEFAQQHQGTVNGFVHGVYDMLFNGGNPSGSEADSFVQAWVPVVASGTLKPSQFATAIAQSPQATAYAVQEIFGECLDRLPDPASSTVDANFLSQTGNLDMLYSAVCGSVEYFQHAQLGEASALGGRASVAITGFVEHFDVAPGAVTFTITVSSADPKSTPPSGGTVTLSENGKDVGQAQFVHGFAQISLQLLPRGSAYPPPDHTYVATYDGTGSSNFQMILQSSPRRITWVDPDGHTIGDDGWLNQWSWPDHYELV
jgi:hypothetical protein